MRHELGVRASFFSMAGLWKKAAMKKLSFNTTITKQKIPSWQSVEKIPSAHFVIFNIPDNFLISKGDVMHKNTS
jgi:hypothetical protein